MAADSPETGETLREMLARALLATGTAETTGERRTAESSGKGTGTMRIAQRGDAGPAGRLIGAIAEELISCELVS